MSKPQVIIIAAVASNRAIGLNNQLLWRLPEDLKRFKALTLGHPILMGRKTFESLGRPLPGRRNVVVSRNPDWQAQGADVFPALDVALSACADAEKVFVIGGAEIYRQALPLADVLDLTEVADAPQGDVFFPELVSGEWQEASREAHEDAATGIRYDFVEYRRTL